MEETGLDAKSIDTCMKLGAGHPMGPLALLDLVGLDVSKAIGEMISTEIRRSSTRRSPPASSAARPARACTRPATNSHGRLAPRVSPIWLVQQTSRAIKGNLDSAESMKATIAWTTIEVDIASDWTPFALLQMLVTHIGKGPAIGGPFLLPERPAEGSIGRPTAMPLGERSDRTAGG